MSLEMCLLNLGLTLFLPLIILGLLGNAIGLSSQQAFMPLRMLISALVGIAGFCIRLFLELTVYFLASRGLAFMRKRNRSSNTK